MSDRGHSPLAGLAYRIGKLNETLRRHRQMTQDFSDYTIYLTGHAHIDRERHPFGTSP